MGEPNLITTVALVEFFSSRYRERNEIKERPQSLEDELFWALRQVEFERVEAHFLKREPKIDFSKENSGFSAHEPVPYDYLTVVIGKYIAEILAVYVREPSKRIKDEENLWKREKIT